MSREGSSVRRRRSSPGGRRQGWGVGHDGPPVPYDQWGPPPGAFGHGPPPPGYFGAPPPPPGPVWQLTPQYGTMPLQPLALPGTVDQLNHVVHQVMCRGCSRAIRGVRWLCAQCGTSPTFDLVRLTSCLHLKIISDTLVPQCSICERSSHLIHNALHCFLVRATPRAVSEAILNPSSIAAHHPAASKTPTTTPSPPPGPVRPLGARSFRVAQQQREQPLGELRWTQRRGRAAPKCHLRQL